MDRLPLHYMCSQQCARDKPDTLRALIARLELGDLKDKVGTHTLINTKSTHTSHVTSR